MVRINFSRKKDLSGGKGDYLILSMDFEQTFGFRGKKFVSFSLTQIFENDFAKFEIIRYDSAHGFVHVHRFYKQKPIVETIESPISKNTFFELRRDIELNWSNYKKWFLEKKGL